MQAPTMTQLATRERVSKSSSSLYVVAKYPLTVHTMSILTVESHRRLRTMMKNYLMTTNLTPTKITMNIPIPITKTCTTTRMLAMLTVGESDCLVIPHTADILYRSFRWRRRCIWLRQHVERQAGNHYRGRRAYTHCPHKLDGSWRQDFCIQRRG